MKNIIENSFYLDIPHPILLPLTQRYRMICVPKENPTNASKRKWPPGAMLARSSERKRKRTLHVEREIDRGGVRPQGSRGEGGLRKDHPKEETIIYKKGKV